MNWEDYQTRFASAALAQNFGQNYISHHLAYAKKLNDQDLPVVYNHRHLSALLGYDAEAVRGASNEPSRLYFTYNIPKRNGGKRLIAEPVESLMQIQRWILNNILNHCPIHEKAMAFAAGKSIKDNASIHLGQPMILSLDIRDFFPSIKRHRVVDVFTAMGYAPEVVATLSGLTLLNDQLPQGAPTSPALSNLVFLKIDQELSLLAAQHRIRYTRYADDLTFSGHFRTGMAGFLFAHCQRLLMKYDLELNINKTRLMKPHQRQEVTGVVVNKKLQATRPMRRRLRQELYYIKKHGLAAHNERSPTLYTNRLDHLRGVAEFILFLNEQDRDALATIAHLGKIRTSYLDKKPEVV